MNFPRFSNPHLRTEQYEVVSRYKLSESDVEGTLEDDAADVQELDALVKRTLGDFAVSEPPRKKRKKKHGDAEHATLSPALVSFRLLSSAPVREYSLLPKPNPEINNEGPPCEDNEDSALLRREQATAAAIDVDWIVRDGYVELQPRRPRKELEVKAASVPDTPPPLALLERPRSRPPVRQELSASAKLSPHETKVKSVCPVLSFSTAETSPSTGLSETARRRMRRNKKREYDRSSIVRPQAMFWRPVLSKHGRTGYAIGYEGSWAVEDEAERDRVGYVRDGIKKAVWADSVV